MIRELYLCQLNYEIYDEPLVAVDVDRIDSDRTFECKYLRPVIRVTSLIERQVRIRYL